MNKIEKKTQSIYIIANIRYDISKEMNQSNKNKTLFFNSECKIKGTTIIGFILVVFNLVKKKRKFILFCRRTIKLFS